MFNDSQIASFKKLEKQTNYHIGQTIELLNKLAKQLDLYTQQQTSDIKAGHGKIGAIYVPLSELNNRLFVDHFPMSYTQNTALVLRHINQTHSIFARWLLTRTLIEMIYDRSKISITDVEKVVDIDTKKKILRYRTLVVLDFKLHMAVSIDDSRWINDYLQMWQHVKKQSEIISAKDLILFPGDRQAIKSDVAKRDRLKLFSSLTKDFNLEKPGGYKLIYDSASRLIHGNPMQGMVSEQVFSQWRERFLVNGLVIRACDDLLKVIKQSVELPKPLILHIDRRITALKKFYSGTLEPTWQSTSKRELNHTPNNL